MKQVQVLGTGCPKCEKLAARAKEAIAALGLDCEVEKVNDITEIVKFGVMMTPALAIDGEVRVTGKVPSVDELKSMLS